MNYELVVIKSKIFVVLVRRVRKLMLAPLNLQVFDEFILFCRDTVSKLVLIEF